MPIAHIFEIKKYNPNHFFGPHKHDQIEINFVKKGTCSLIFDDDTIHFGKNDIMIILPNTKHCFKTHKKNAELIQLEFDISILNDRFSELNQNLFDQLARYFKHCIKITHHQSIAGNIQKIVKELNEKKPEYELLVKLFYQEIFIYMHRHLHDLIVSPVGHHNFYIDKAIKYINNHYSDQNLLKRLTAELNITDRHLRSLFHTHAGISPKKYILNIRLNKSKEFLLEQDLSAKETALICGFSSYQYFYQFFRNHAGISPGEFKKRNSGILYK